jgi:hypothetical protein
MESWGGNQTIPGEEQTERTKARKSGQKRQNERTGANGESGNPKKQVSQRFCIPAAPYNYSALASELSEKAATIAGERTIITKVAPISRSCTVVFSL